MRRLDSEMRIDELSKVRRRRRLDQVFVTGQADIMALTGVDTDNGVLTEDALYTDFRYIPAARRIAPGLKIVDIKRFRPAVGRVGCDFRMPHDRLLAFQKRTRKAKLVDISKDLSAIRAVKTPEEVDRIRAAERLVCEIWKDACARFKPGMTERGMAAIIKRMMIDRGDGEAFETIVCIGKNAAECHHIPDNTVWNGREPILVDIGVKLGGVCSDLTRNLVPKRPSKLYRKVYDLVLKANMAAIAAAKPGITGKALDRVARRVIAEGGFGKCFGHSLGHGVGLEVHEEPALSKKSDTVLKSGMIVTVEPGIYLEDNLGVRIEDLVLITETGCEVLSTAEK